VNAVYHVSYMPVAAGWRITVSVNPHSNSFAVNSTSGGIVTFDILPVSVAQPAQLLSASVFYNGSQNELVVKQNNDQPLQITITNMLGQQLVQTQTAQQQTVVSCSLLAPGIYSATLTDVQGNVHSQLFAVQQQ
ncbi:MAG: T9SS type A sorting domain-containing protein, partial [Bacteroidia bacterium]